MPSTRQLPRASCTPHVPVTPSIPTMCSPHTAARMPTRQVLPTLPTNATTVVDFTPLLPTNFPLHVFSTARPAQPAISSPDLRSVLLVSTAAKPYHGSGLSARATDAQIKPP